METLSQSAPAVAIESPKVGYVSEVTFGGGPFGSKTRTRRHVTHDEALYHCGEMEGTRNPMFGDVVRAITVTGLAREFTPPPKPEIPYPEPVPVVPETPELRSQESRGPPRRAIAAAFPRRSLAAPSVSTSDPSHHSVQANPGGQPVKFTRSRAPP